MSIRLYIRSEAIKEDNSWFKNYFLAKELIDVRGIRLAL